MPTYDYRCENCGTVFDRRVAIAERDQVACPNCGIKPAKRLITGGNFMKTGGCYSASDCSSNGCGSGGFS